jgi:hypothetical protein
MLFDRPVPTRTLRPTTDARHRRRIEYIVAAFAKAYPNIEYDVYWDSRSLNAQAFVWEGKLRVRLYGGAALHRKVSIAGIAWILAHETGHHLGGPPFHALQPHLSAEETADAWAAQRGLRHVFGRRLARRYATQGRCEVQKLHH